MAVAVIGAGVIGLATTSFLLDLDVDVTCFEAVAPMSQRSTGASRIFRLAHQTPELVELAGRARVGYRTWSDQAGEALIHDVGTVVTGRVVTEWAAAMAAAGAEHDLLDSGSDRVRLPMASVAGPLLIDPTGGVLQAHRVGALLRSKTTAAMATEPVYRVENQETGTTVWSAHGRRVFDATIIVAGAGTCALAAQVGLYTPSTLAHHIRFTFPLRAAESRPQCLLERSESWKPGFTTYQHLSGAGEWAVGAHIDPSESAWELGPDRVEAYSRRLVGEYVKENLSGVEPRIIDELHCSFTPGLGDGFVVHRAGATLVLYGDNLFKLAPVLGRMLAEAAVTGSTPSSVSTSTLGRLSDHRPLFEPPFEHAAGEPPRAVSG